MLQTSRYIPIADLYNVIRKTTNDQKKIVVKEALGIQIQSKIVKEYFLKWWQIVKNDPKNGEKNGQKEFQKWS